MNRDDPFIGLPAMPALAVTSCDVREGEPLDVAQLSGASGVPGGLDRSPHLSWSRAPGGTTSHAVTVYDSDAPAGSGFWHWAVANIPAGVTELPTGAGDETGSGLPHGTVQSPNDARLNRQVGAGRPAGQGSHHYHLTAHALDVDDIGIPAERTPAFLGFNMTAHTLARATIIATAERPAQTPDFATAE